MSGAFETSLRSLLRPTVINAAVQMLRETVPGVVKSYDAAVAVVLDGLSASLANSAKRTSVTNFIATSGVVCSVADIGTLLKPGVTPAAVSAGNHLLDLLFGERVGAIANQIGRSSGVKSSSAYILLSLAASTAAGELSQRLNHERITASRLVRVIEGQPQAAFGLASLRRHGSSAPAVAVGRSRAPVVLRAGAARAGAGGVARAMALWTLGLSLASVLGFVVFDVSTRAPQLTARTALVRPSNIAPGGREQSFDAAEREAPVVVAVAGTLPAERPSAERQRVAPPPVVPSLAMLSGAANAASAEQAHSVIGKGDTAGPAGERPSEPEVVVPQRAVLNSLVVVPLAAPQAEAVAGVTRSVTSVEDQLIGYLEDGGPADSGRWFDFEGFKFRTGSAVLSEASNEQIALIAQILTAFPQVGLTIAGFTDNQGDPGHNKQLSEARAKAVMSSLVRRGVAADRLTASGFGAERPIADNSTASGRARNRRIAIAVTTK